MASWWPALVTSAFHSAHRLECRLQRGNFELVHLEHRLHRAVAAFVAAAEQAGEHVGNDLPGQPELVLQPSALIRHAAVADQLVPQGVDLTLRLAAEEKRD